MFLFTTIKEIEISYIINYLKNSTTKGHYNINILIVKECKFACASLLMHLLNNSFRHLVSSENKN